MCGEAVGMVSVVLLVLGALMDINTFRASMHGMCLDGNTHIKIRRTMMARNRNSDDVRSIYDA